MRFGANGKARGVRFWHHLTGKTYLFLAPHGPGISLFGSCPFINSIHAAVNSELPFDIFLNRRIQLYTYSMSLLIVDNAAVLSAVTPLVLAEFGSGNSSDDVWYCYRFCRPYTSKATKHVPFGTKLLKIGVGSFFFFSFRKVGGPFLGIILIVSYSEYIPTSLYHNWYLSLKGQ